MWSFLSYQFLLPCPQMSSDLNHPHPQSRSPTLVYKLSREDLKHMWVIRGVLYLPRGTIGRRLHFHSPDKSAGGRKFQKWNTLGREGQDPGIQALPGAPSPLSTCPSHFPHFSRRGFNPHHSFRVGLCQNNLWAGTRNCLHPARKQTGIWAGAEETYCSNQSQTCHMDGISEQTPS